MVFEMDDMEPGKGPALVKSMLPRIKAMSEEFSYMECTQKLISDGYEIPGRTLAAKTQQLNKFMIHNGYKQKNMNGRRTQPEIAAQGPLERIRKLVALEGSPETIMDLVAAEVGKWSDG